MSIQKKKCNQKLYLTVHRNLLLLPKKIQMLMSQLPPFGNSSGNLDVDTLASRISGLKIFAGWVQ